MKNKKQSKTLGGAKYERWENGADSNLYPSRMAPRDSSQLPISNSEQIINILLNNRGIKTIKQKKAFFNPESPDKLTLKDVGIQLASVKKTIERIRKAKKNKEKIIVYGDYDADGVSATAILWETLYSYGTDCLPYIPERFSEGYGINPESVVMLRRKFSNLGLIITVDNGIVAYDGVAKAKKLGIDVIVTDHHIKEKKLPDAYSIIHTTRLSGAAISWILAREIVREVKGKQNSSSMVGEKLEIGKESQDHNNGEGLELAAVGLIADQIPLIGVARSFAKYGLAALNRTTRPGLLALFQIAGVEKGNLGTYDVNFIIAPRINAMGRLENAMESLRLVCTKNKVQAEELAIHLNKVNLERQKIVEEVVMRAREQVKVTGVTSVIVVSDGSYHEGVIGLAAAKLVEEYYRPSIVISEKTDIAKASARSITGFNIIEAIRSQGNLIEGGGGHPMAAGFSIKNEMIQKFTEKLNSFSEPLLTKELLAKKLILDMEIDFNQINWELANKLAEFEPTGIGNYQPSFLTRGVQVLEARPVGRQSKHLKLTLQQDSKVFNAIAFNFGDLYTQLLPGTSINLVYTIEKNVWRDTESLQLRVRDVDFS